MLEISEMKLDVSVKKRPLFNTFSSSSKRMRTSKNSEEEALDPKMELEKKRQASRESSRRTRERERSKVDFFKSNKLKLEDENEKIRAENERLRRLIQLVKEGTAQRYSSATTAAAAPATTHANVVMPPPAPVPLQYSTPTVQQPLAQADMTSLPQVIMGFLSNLVVASQTQTQAKHTPTVPAVQVDQNQLLSLVLTQLATQANGTTN